MPRAAMPRLPVDALLRFAEQRQLNASALSQLVSPGAHRDLFRGKNGITWGAADRFACALDVNPMSIWPEEWQAVCDAYDARYSEVKQKKMDQYAAKRRERQAADEEQGWRDIERSWRQWRLQRDRWELDREVVAA